jgi:hypothetical protein
VASSTLECAADDDATRTGRASCVSTTPVKLRAAFFVGSAAWLLACGDEDAPPAATTPGPASLVITSLAPRGNALWTAPDGDVVGDPQPVALDCDGRLGVSVATRGLDETETISWAYRTPGACGSSPNCGYLRIDFDPLQPLTLETTDACNNRTGTDGSDGSDGDPPTRTSLSCRSGASANLAFDLSSLERAALAGPHVIRAALYRDSKTPVRDRAGAPLQVELSVEFAAPSCIPGGEGGAFGEAGAPGAAGSAASTAGAGGESGAG